MRKNLELILRGGVVKRYHVMDTLKSQTVAEHSFGVAWLAWLLCDGKPSVELVMAALKHDLAEHVTGDLPAPAKRSLGIGAQFAAYEADVLLAAGIPEFKLTHCEQRTLKFADTCELLLFCLREMSMGNAAMDEVYQRGWAYVCELGLDNQAEVVLRDYIQGEYNALISK